MTIKRYNLYTTQHQKHLHAKAETLLTLIMNIILCEKCLLKTLLYFLLKIFALMEGVETKF